MTYWERFEKLCNDIGERPSPVGKKIGVSATTISKWKNGAIPNGEILLAVADYFNVSTDYLLGRTINPVTNTSANNMSGNNNNESNSINIGAKPEEVFSGPTDNVTKKFFDVFIHLDFSQQVNVVKYALEQAKKSA